MISSALSWRKWKKKCGAGEVPFRRAAVRPAPRRHWLNLRCRCPEGAWRFRSPADLAFSLLSCPPSPKGKDIPPTPFPSGEGGDLGLFYARGEAPCIPGAEPERHLQSLPSRFPEWGFAPCEAEFGRHSGARRGRGGFSRLPTLPLAYFPAPIPPCPPSRREGGGQRFFYARGFAPCIPGAEPGRHLQNLPSRFPEWGCAPCGAEFGRHSGARRGRGG